MSTLWNAGNAFSGLKNRPDDRLSMIHADYQVLVRSRSVKKALQNGASGEADWRILLITRVDVRVVRKAEEGEQKKGRKMGVLFFISVSAESDLSVWQLLPMKLPYVNYGSWHGLAWKL